MVRPLAALALALACAALVLSAPAQAQVLATGVRTIFLPRAATGETPMNVAHHPGFNRYYASNGGSSDRSAYVYDAGGSLLQTQDPINIDVRAWNYNPNTGQLEVVSYNAIGGGVGYGLILPGVDGTGALTGATSTLLASMPGLISTQTMPAYDPAANAFYSRDSGAAVNVASRTTGGLASSFNLDLAAAGNPTLSQYSIGYDPAQQWIVVVSPAPNSRAYVFGTAGAYIGSSALDVDVGSNYGMGYANGQLFVFDDVQGGWQGYDIGGGGGIGPQPVQIAQVPALSPLALVLLSPLLAGGAWLASRRRRSAG